MNLLFGTVIFLYLLCLCVCLIPSLSVIFQDCLVQDAVQEERKLENILVDLLQLLLVLLQYRHSAKVCDSLLAAMVLNSSLHEKRKEPHQILFVKACPRGTSKSTTGDDWDGVRVLSVLGTNCLQIVDEKPNDASPLEEELLALIRSESDIHHILVEIMCLMQSDNLVSHEFAVAHTGCLALPHDVKKERG